MFGFFLLVLGGELLPERGEKILSKASEGSDTKERYPPS
jgi:hypothetical protein